MNNSPPTICLQSQDEASLLQVLESMASDPAQGGDPAAVLGASAQVLPGYELMTDWQQLFESWRGKPADFMGLRRLRQTLESLSLREVDFGQGYEPAALLQLTLLYFDSAGTSSAGLHIQLSGYVALADIRVVTTH